MKKILFRLKQWYKFDRPASFFDWILVRSLAAVLSSLVGWGIVVWLFSLMLSILQK